MRGSEAMRCTGIDLQSRARHQLRGEQRRVGNRHDLVIIAMDDQCWDVNLLEVSCEIRLGECLDAIERSLEADLHAPEPEHVAYALRDLHVRSVRAVEGRAQVLVEL